MQTETKVEELMARIAAKEAKLRAKGKVPFGERTPPVKVVHKLKAPRVFWGGVESVAKLSDGSLHIRRCRAHN